MSESNIPDIPPTEVAKAFQSAAITALQELTQIEAYPESILPAMENMPSEEAVLAAIQLLRHVPGTMTLVLTATAASQLAVRYLPHGTQLTEELVNDVAGEFANVITGQAKTILKGTPYHFRISTPVVTRAASPAQLHHLAGASCITLLASELGRLLLVVDLPTCPNA